MTLAGGVTRVIAPIEGTMPRPLTLTLSPLGRGDSFSRGRAAR
jgi:hypothetical protein